jgi:hypothetical protein
MTPVLAGQLEYNDGPTGTRTFRHDGTMSTEIKIISLLGDRFVHARRAIKNASIIKGVVAVSQTFRSIVPKEVPRDTASKVHIRSRRSQFVCYVSGRSTVRDDRRLSRTSPDDFLE